MKLDYDEVAHERLDGGLDLRDMPGQLPPGAALDLLNVWAADVGRIGSRPGYHHITDVDLINPIRSLGGHETTLGSKLLVHTAVGLILADRDGSPLDVGGAVGYAGKPASFARLGLPTAERTYIANGAQLRYLEGAAVATTIAAPAGTAGVAEPRYIAVQPKEARLVGANYAGSAQDRNPSALRFADSANPGNFAVNSFVRFTPGDGEEITGLAAWRELLFALKPSKVMCFYGNSDDALANPIFNFEIVDTGLGCTTHGAYCVGPDGLYFLHRTGIYRMAGIEPPTKISAALDPLFEGNVPPWCALPAIVQPDLSTQIERLVWHDDRLYCALRLGAAVENSHTLVWDVRDDSWVVWNLPIRAAIAWRGSDRHELVFAPNNGSGRVAAMSLSDSSDRDAVGAAVAIDSHVQYGYDDYASNQARTMRQSKLHGTGTVRVKYVGDHGTVPVDADAATAVFGPDLTSRIVRPPSVRAERHSIVLDGDQAWEVQRMVHHLTPPGGRPQG